MKFRKPTDVFNERSAEKKITHLNFTSVIMRIDELAKLVNLYTFFYFLFFLLFVFVNLII
jgi:hypothetical protein